MKGLTRAVGICVRSGVVVAVALGAMATTSHAQDTTLANGVRMHTVHAGETLWDLAQNFLGDGELWPEIVKANRGLVQDSHWIFPNEMLRIPPRPANAPPENALAAKTPAAAAPAQPVAPTPTSPPPAPVAAAEPTPPTPSAPTEPDAETAAAPDEGAATAPGATLFNHPPERQNMFAAGGRMGGMVSRRREGVAAGDHNSAPYLDRDGGPRNAGSVVGVADLSDVIVTAEVEHFGLGQDVYITMPRGAKPEVGQRYYTYALGQSFGDHGQVIEPTGIVTVVRPGTGNVATIARITEQYAYMQLHQGVLPVDPAILPNSAPAPLAGGALSHVVWVEHNQVLPTVGFYVLLDNSAKTGVHIGDQITLFRPRERLQTPNGDVTLPESDIAVAQVVRVTPYGVSAVIIAQDQPAVEPGVTGRVTARVSTGGQ